jgi:hypothetical protein
MVNQSSFIKAILSFAVAFWFLGNFPKEQSTVAGWETPYEIV